MILHASQSYPLFKGPFLPIPQVDPRIREYRNVACYLARRFVPFVHGQLDFDDLHSIALTALWRATRDFRETEGVSFNTYAYRCISNALEHEQQRVHRARRRTWLRSRVLDMDQQERSSAFASADPTPEKAYASLETARAVLDAAKPKNRAVVAVLLEGGSLQEAADVRGITREQARNIFKGACEHVRRGVSRNERRH